MDIVPIKIPKESRMAKSPARSIPLLDPVYKNAVKRLLNRKLKMETTMVEEYAFLE
ncbi:MAG: hypothetical protein ACJASQ_001372 [Crocinitomicaceae bacterium]|jgi:hypothetical protein